MRTVEKSSRRKVQDKKDKLYKTVEEAFQAKHDVVKELIRNVDLSQLGK